MNPKLKRSSHKAPARLLFLSSLVVLVGWVAYAQVPGQGTVTNSQSAERNGKTVPEAMRERSMRPPVTQGEQRTTARPRRITVLQAIRQQYGEDRARKLIRVVRVDHRGVEPDK
jgi:hypothetical protein